MTDDTFDASEEMKQFRLRPSAEYFRRVLETAKHRKADRVEFGLTGGLGNEAMANYRLTATGHPPLAISGLNHRPHSGPAFTGAHLTKPYTLKQVEQLKTCANERS